MLIKNYTIEPLGNSECLLSWESEHDDVVSWIFINGRKYLGPFMADTKARSMEIPFSATQTIVVEIHDFDDLETIPQPVEIAPLTKPGIGWNAVEDARTYRLYHGVFGSGEKVVETYPALAMDRFEIDCPLTLAGRNGKWHRLRVESVDKFGTESTGESFSYFAANLPPVPGVYILRDSETSTFTFMIGD